MTGKLMGSRQESKNEWRKIRRKDWRVRMNPVATQTAASRSAAAMAAQLA
jgi:hypothetical protein